jgi:DNA-binding NtrC family response regulator
MGDSGRVLLVGQDRRFRAVASALLTRRDYSVTVADGREDIAELVSRERPDVVVIDAIASLTALARDVARLETLRPRVGVVVVSSDLRERITALPVIAKWSAFDALFAAIEQARPNHG